MEYRRLGKSGLKLSALSFGSWLTFHNQVNESSAIECMNIAYDAGVNFFDNAEVYAGGASEEIMGNALKKLGWRRDTYCVSSKVYWGGEKPTQKGLSAKHITDACHAALRRLKVDYLDLYFCHRPDIETPIEETVRAMHHLITQGKVLYWGTSEWSADQITEAYGAAYRFGLTPPTMEQPQYNMFHRDRVESELLHLCKESGLGITSWSPLASGILTGKYVKGIPSGTRMSIPGYEWLRELVESDEGRARIQKTQRLQEIAAELGISVAQMAIAWCLKNPNVSTVLLGASKATQLQENLKALDAANLLTPMVMEKIETVLGNTPEPPRIF